MESSHDMAGGATPYAAWLRNRLDQLAIEEIIAQSTVSLFQTGKGLEEQIDTFITEFESILKDLSEKQTLLLWEKFKDQ